MKENAILAFSFFIYRCCFEDEILECNVRFGYNLPDNQAFPLIRCETEARRDKACLVSTTGRKAHERFR